MNGYEDILDLDEKIDEDGKIVSLKKKSRGLYYKYEYEEPILLCDIINDDQDYNNLNNKSNSIKTILQKLNRTKTKNEENEEFFDFLLDKNYSYEDFSKNKIKIDHNLKLMIGDLSSNKKFNDNDRTFESINFSIFTPEEEMFKLIFKQMKILFLKPIMDFGCSTLNEDSKINLDLFKYIDFYIESNIKSLINYFSDEFFIFITGQKKYEIEINDKNDIRENENYIVFIKKAYQKFENLSMLHFKFLDSKINFFNSCLKHIIFLVLQVNFIQNSFNQNYSLSHNQIEIFLEKFFKKISQN